MVYYAKGVKKSIFSRDSPHSLTMPIGEFYAVPKNGRNLEKINKIIVMTVVYYSRYLPMISSSRSKENSTESAYSIYSENNNNE